MTKSVKIFGAGSIGNHMANACRSMGWKVDICDVDEQALSRTKLSIYPGRYGKWDDSINLYRSSEAPKKDYDLVIIGTPPDSHFSIALDVLERPPETLLIEKPLCTPDLKDADALVERLEQTKVAAFVGYDHVIGFASAKLEELVTQKGSGEIQNIDVEFKEHWGGIFAAHPWLNGPSDTYLGYWEKGGGALSEHSHALNLWQYLAHLTGCGRVTEVSALINYVKDGKANYDVASTLHLKTENGVFGRVLQDVVTAPPRKWARIQGKEAVYEWQAHRKPGVDFTSYKKGEQILEEYEFKKTRPEDFILEMKHLEKYQDNHAKSPISLARGLETMMVIAAAHKAVKLGRSVSINYGKGYNDSAIN